MSSIIRADANCCRPRSLLADEIARAKANVPDHAALVGAEPDGSGAVGGGTGVLGVRAGARRGVFAGRDNKYENRGMMRLAAMYPNLGDAPK